MHSNSKSQKTASPKCPFKRWELVLYGDESNPEFCEALSHVEGCPECQTRIDASVTTDMPWWNEAKDSWLENALPIVKSDTTSGSVIIEIQSEMPEDSRIEYETVMLSFLDAPSHPELLGRLGRYEVERVIGTGGMGIVLKAHDTELHRVVAIKVLATHLASNASARRRFAREAQAAAAVLHPNVIPIYDVASDAKLPYIVMQCVSGQSLQSKVDEHGSLPLADVLRIAKQTAAGLAAAHDQGLVHRDVKPANILLEENVDRVLLSDFGLARAVDDASLTRTGVVAGTPHYMSPEQARGDAIDTRSDQFSLGSVMYYMLTGRPPFRANGAMGVLNRICTEQHRSIDQVNHEIPLEVVALVDKLLEKSAVQRFASMHAVELELERLLALLQSGGLSLTKRKTHAKSTNIRSKRLKSMAAVVIPIAIGAAITYAIVRPTERNQSNVRTEKVAIRAALQQLADSQRIDNQIQQDLLQLQSEVNSIQRRVPSEYQSDTDSFYQEVQSIQLQIRAFENQYPFSPDGE